MILEFVEFLSFRVQYENDNFMAEIITTNTKSNKCNFSKSHNRRSTRVDLTPMVDLGFLLITFFVFTTSMIEPKTMDLLEPHNGDPKPIKNSCAMTIIVSKNHTIYYYYGLLDKMNAINQIKKTNTHSLRNLIVDMKRKTDPAYLMFILKADEESIFADNIDLLDEMSICNIQSGHYAEIDITPDEALIIKSKN